MRPLIYIQFLRWAHVRSTEGIENEKSNYLSFVNKVLVRQVVSVLGRLNRGITVFHTQVAYSEFFKI